MDPKDTQETNQVHSTPQDQQQEQASEQYKDLGEYEIKQEKVQVTTKNIAVSSYGPRVRIAKLYDSHEEFLYKIIKVAGWVKTTRQGSKDFVFIELSDGSHMKGIQVVVDKSIDGYEQIQKVNVGTSMLIKGTLIKSPATGQLFELQCSQADKHEVTIYGQCDPAKYPLSKKKHSVEFLREIAHLRPRTNLIGAVTRVRNNLAFATHLFFQQKGFLYIHTPIITASDCEGAGEMFAVTTMIDPEKAVKDLPLIDGREEEVKKEEIKKGGKQDKKAKKKQEKGEQSDVIEQQTEGEKKKEEQLPVEQKPLIPLEERKFNYKKEIFGKPTFLTVSGQLNVENYCCSLTDCYTFGPTFRAENSHTTRHLAEFWMIEPELAFATLSDNMDCAEEYLKFCLAYVLQNNKDEIAFFDQFVEKGLKERLQHVVDTPFKRITYTEAIDILLEKINDKKAKVKFVLPVEWGIDLATEHERFLTDKVFEGPIIVYNYPKHIKAFYMRQNEDGKTVQAMDILVPRIGEIIGGSAREERLDLLDKRIDEQPSLNKEAYWWYRQLREYGSIPHAGFGLGFERLVMMSTGVENIREVIPFPRAPGQAEF